MTYDLQRAKIRLEIAREKAVLAAETARRLLASGEAVSLLDLATAETTAQVAALEVELAQIDVDELSPAS